MALFGVAAAAEADRPTRQDYLSLAEKGWVFEFRSSLMRRDGDLPSIQFNAKKIAASPVCIFGAVPRPETQNVLTQFHRLLGQTFAPRAPFSYAGRMISDCAPHQRIYLRIYEGYPPTDIFNMDLRWLDAQFGIGLPKGRSEKVRSPAQGIGYFGRKGDVTHLLINQSDRADPTQLQREFYRSILVEELFQTVTYGLDILKFNAEAPFLSKLQEFPTNLTHIGWGTERYMRGLLSSNPKGLCGFDVFMLHALAQMTLESSNSQAFLDFIDMRFDDLLARTQMTLSSPSFTLLLDRSCLVLPEEDALKAVKK